MTSEREANSAAVSWMRASSGGGIKELALRLAGRSECGNKCILVRGVVLAVAGAEVMGGRVLVMGVVTACGGRRAVLPLPVVTNDEAGVEDMVGKAGVGVHTDSEGVATEGVGGVLEVGVQVEGVSGGDIEVRRVLFLLLVLVRGREVSSS